MRLASEQNDNPDCCTNDDTSSPARAVGIAPRGNTQTFRIIV